MNKLLTKIVGLSLGLSMAIGVGVAASYSEKDAVRADAAVTPDPGYTAATMTAGTNGSACTVDDEDGIKVGTSSKGGNMSVTVPANATDLRVYAAAWKGVTGLSLNISGASVSPSSISLTADNGISNNSPFTLAGNKEDFCFDISLSGIVSETTITFTSSIAKRFVLWDAQYKSQGTTTPTITLNKTEMTIDLNGDSTFTVTAQNLTSAFTVTSSDSSKVSVSSISPSASKDDGVYTVTLHGEAITASNVNVVVASTGAESKTVSVSVQKLPLIDANLNSFTWNHSSYATSPHLLTYNERYDFVLSSGQLNGTTAFLGSNVATQIQVSLDTWTLKGTTIASAIDSWSTYGSAFYMSNFGIIHPTSFKINAGTVGNIGTTRDYYILASLDSGETWTIKASGTVAAETDMGWSGSDYVSTSSAVQFAFVMSYSAIKTISNITVNAAGDSLATTKVLDSIYVEGTPNTNCNVGVPYDIGANAVVKAHYTDSVSYPDENVTSQVSWTSIEHDSTSVTGTYNSKTVTIDITPVSEGSIYKKVRGTNELLVGSYVVIGRSDSKYVAGSQATNNRNANNSDSFGYYDDGDLENYSFSTAVFEIGTTENGYTFYDTSANGYLYAASSSNNYLKTKSEIDANGNSEWSITFDSEGVATIVAQGDHTHNSMNISSSGNIVFGAYLSDEEFTSNVSLFVNVEHNVQLFVDGYMHMTDPDYEGEGTGLCKSAGTYLAAKEAIISLGDVYIDEFENNSVFEDAYLRYTKWAIANGDTSPFEGTGIVSAGSIGGIFGALDDNIATIIVIVVSGVAITSIGALLVLKKRKEQF